MAEALSESKSLLTKQQEEQLDEAMEIKSEADDVLSVAGSEN